MSHKTSQQANPADRMEHGVFVKLFGIKLILASYTAFLAAADPGRSALSIKALSIKNNSDQKE